MKMFLDPGERNLTHSDVNLHRDCGKELILSRRVLPSNFELSGFCFYGRCQFNNDRKLSETDD
jgi:hypothetical protein